MEKQLQADPSLDGDPIRFARLITTTALKGNVNEALEISREAVNTVFGLEVFQYISNYTFLRCDELADYAFQHGFRFSRYRSDHLMDEMFVGALRDRPGLFRLLHASGSLTTPLMGTMTGMRIFLRANNPRILDRAWYVDVKSIYNNGYVLEHPIYEEVLRSIKDTEWTVSDDARLIVVITHSSGMRIMYKSVYANHVTSQLIYMGTD